MRIFFSLIILLSAQQASAKKLIATVEGMICDFCVQGVGKMLEKYDMIIVPGGYGTEDLQENEVFKTWLKTAENVPYKVSICTGSLLLGAVGFLQNKKATTHFDNYKNLEKYCNSVVKERIVEDGQLITAGAVASSLDLGLFLCEKLAGSVAKNKIQQSMDYHSV